MADVAGAKDAEWERLVRADREGEREGEGERQRRRESWSQSGTGRRVYLRRTGDTTSTSGSRPVPRTTGLPPLQTTTEGVATEGVTATPLGSGHPQQVLLLRPAAAREKDTHRERERERERDRDRDRDLDGDIDSRLSSYLGGSLPHSVLTTGDSHLGPRRDPDAQVLEHTLVGQVPAFERTRRQLALVKETFAAVQRSSQRERERERERDVAKGKEPGGMGKEQGGKSAWMTKDGESVAARVLRKVEAERTLTTRLETLATLSRREAHDRRKKLRAMTVDACAEEMREEHALTLWEQRQREWEATQQTIARRLGRPAGELLMANTDAVRERREEIELLERSVPVHERYGSTSWEMSLRQPLHPADHAHLPTTRHIQIGGAFPYPLYCSVPDTPRHPFEAVRNPERVARREREEERGRSGVEGIEDVVGDNAALEARERAKEEELQQYLQSSGDRTNRTRDRERERERDLRDPEREREREREGASSISGGATLGTMSASGTAGVPSAMQSSRKRGSQKQSQQNMQSIKSWRTSTHLQSRRQQLAQNIRTHKEYDSDFGGLHVEGRTVEEFDKRRIEDMIRDLREGPGDVLRRLKKDEEEQRAARGVTISGEQTPAQSGHVLGEVPSGRLSVSVTSTAGTDAEDEGPLIHVAPLSLSLSPSLSLSARRGGREREREREGEEEGESGDEGESIGDSEQSFGATSGGSSDSLDDSNQPLGHHTITPPVTYLHFGSASAGRSQRGNHGATHRGSSSTRRSRRLHPTDSQADTQTLVMRNLGRVAVYLTLERIGLDTHFVNDNTGQATRPGVPGNNSEGGDGGGSVGDRFFTTQWRKVLHPGDSWSVDVVYRSKVPGQFQDRWALTSVPPAFRTSVNPVHQLMDDGPSTSTPTPGAQTHGPDHHTRTERVWLHLKGITTVDERNSLARFTYVDSRLQDHLGALMNQVLNQEEEERGERPQRSRSVLTETADVIASSANTKTGGERFHIRIGEREREMVALVSPPLWRLMNAIALKAFSLTSTSSFDRYWSSSCDRLQRLVDLSGHSRLSAGTRLLTSLARIHAFDMIQLNHGAESKSSESSKNQSESSEKGTESLEGATESSANPGESSSSVVTVVEAKGMLRGVSCEADTSTPSGNDVSAVRRTLVTVALREGLCAMADAVEQTSGWLRSTVRPPPTTTSTTTATSESSSSLSLPLQTERDILAADFHNQRVRATTTHALRTMGPDLRSLDSAAEESAGGKKKGEKGGEKGKGKEKEKDGAGAGRDEDPFFTEEWRDAFEARWEDAKAGERSEERQQHRQYRTLQFQHSRAAVSHCMDVASARVRAQERALRLLLEDLEI